MTFDVEQPMQPEEARLFLAELQEWVDSLPEPEPLPPCCGRCRHFEARDIDGINGVCRARTYYEFMESSVLTLNPTREATDEVCHLYAEACPF